MLSSIITGHEAMLAPHREVFDFAVLPRRRRRAGRRNARRRAPGPDRPAPPDLAQSMRHISATLWSSAREQQSECDVSSPNGSGIVCVAWQRHGGRS